MSSLISLHDRIRGSIWGQFVGDAAAMGTHWIYDTEELESMIPGGVIGFETPRPGHYHSGKIPGDQTHYGDAALHLLESLAERGGFNERDFGMRFQKHFSAPDCGSYKDHATRETLKNLQEKPEDFQNGAHDNQGSSITRMAPLVAAFHHSPFSMLENIVTRCTKVTQNHPEAIAFNVTNASLLQSLFDGAGMREAVDKTCDTAPCDITDHMEAAASMLATEVKDATAHFGQSCPLVQCFPAALHCAMKHSDDFAHCIQSTIRAGGDTAARASMIGAWLGALHGVQFVPKNWRQRLTANERIHEAVEQLLSFAV